MKSPILAYLESLHQQLAGQTEGDVARYIPELAKADPDHFGICLVTLDGQSYSVGDSERPFTIQSISKPFVYATALSDRGAEEVVRHVGVEPSGDAFNSISLDPHTGAPLNPMINAGAIAAAGLVAGDTAERQWQRIARAMAAYMGRPVEPDDAVYQSESRTGFRNRAIAWMLKNFGIIAGDPMAVLENYFRQCSLLVTCRDLAYMAATLANGGVQPRTGERALAAEHVEPVLSVMSTCGMYDYAGSWLYEVGMPAKSGVGGGIIAVLPGRFGIGVYSPRLDVKGNSVRGIATCQRLSRDFGLHMLSHAGDPRTALGRIYTATDAPSRRQPNVALRACLEQQAQRIKYLALHGALTVDAVEYVIRRLQALAADSHSFILDLHQVTCITSSAARLLNQARRGFASDGIALVFSRIHDRHAILEALSKSAGPGDCGFLSFEDNDLAVEWCENRLCASAVGAPAEQAALDDIPLFRGLNPALLRRIDTLAHSQDFAPGASILVADEAGDGRIYGIISGQVSILVPLSDGAHQRIATLGPGMCFGEMALLGGSPPWPDPLPPRFRKRPPAPVCYRLDCCSYSASASSQSCSS